MAIMDLIKKITDKFKMFYYTSNSERYVKYVKWGGEIGDNVLFRDPHTTRIDMTRPCLLSIGNNVDINVNFQILTHDWCTYVFRNLFHDFINSSGKVSIGNNVYIATNVTILKGVSIGDNCIIGAGSIVTKSIPSNSVAAGIPCRVICSIEDYYEKRKKQALEEAKEYVRYFRERNGRNPQASELWEEFIFFIDHSNINDYPEIPVRKQLNHGYSDWICSHKAPFPSIEVFLASIK